MTAMQKSINKVIMQIKSIPTKIKQKMLALMSQDKHNNTSITPFRPSNKIEVPDSKQLPSLIKDTKIITSPTEVNNYRKVTLKDADIETKKRTIRGHVPGYWQN